MKNFAALTDPVYVEKTGFTSYERFWLRRINDRKDLPFVHLLTTIHLTVLPLALMLILPLLRGVWWWLFATGYFYYSQLYLKGRFGLMYHCLCHRQLFRKRFHWLHDYITWVVTPFFGHTQETYFGHHIGMHHRENNLPDDSSSTMRYQRDSLSHFLVYYGRFLLLGFKETFTYLYLKQRNKIYFRFFMGEMICLCVYITLCFLHLKAALVIFVIPLFFGRLVMMLGNWAQHAFVDPANPGNIYTNCVNCINTDYNRICWNDGYHIIHHLRPGLHYTDMPTEFMRQKEALAANRSLIFDGIHYLHIFFYLVTKRYDKLATNLVNLHNVFPNEQAAIALMQERAKQIKTTQETE